MAGDNAVHIKLAADGTPTMYDQHGNSLGPVGNSDSLKIGAKVECFSIAFSDNVSQDIPLAIADTDHVVYYWLYGLIVNQAGTRFVVPQAGRYLMHGWIQFLSHATAWYQVSLFVEGGNGESGRVIVPPQSVTGLSTFYDVQVATIVEKNVGDEIGWSAGEGGGGIDTSLNDSYFSVQYLGPRAD